MAKGKRRKPREASAGGGNQIATPSNGPPAMPSRLLVNQDLPDMPFWQGTASQGFMPGPVPPPQFHNMPRMPAMGIPPMPMYSGIIPDPTGLIPTGSWTPNTAGFQTHGPPMQEQQLPLRPQQVAQIPQSNGSAPKAGYAAPRPLAKKAKALTRDAIVPPSEESGGVPDPSPAYLVRASFIPQRVETCKPILVVIDLNGTLLHRPNRASPSKFVARPHAADFLSYCVRTFWVVIWSSARPANVRNMCASLIPQPELLKRVVAIWGRDQFGLTAEDYNRRVQCYKRLTRVWENDLIAKSHPDYAQGGRWTQGNTVLVDDSMEKARSEPHNLLQIPEFAGDVHEKPEILPQVHDYLNELCFQSDVSTYIRKHPYEPGPEGWAPERSA